MRSGDAADQQSADPTSGVSARGSSPSDGDSDCSVSGTKDQAVQHFWVVGGCGNDVSPQIFLALVTNLTGTADPGHRVEQ